VDNGKAKPVSLTILSTRVKVHLHPTMDSSRVRGNDGRYERDDGPSRLLLGLSFMTVSALWKHVLTTSLVHDDSNDF
jgi:hypothetical protein